MSNDVQSHLSTTNSQTRLRATTSSATVILPRSSPGAPIVPSPNRFTILLRFLCQLEDHGKSSWRLLAIKWMVLVYCFASLLFSTTTLYAFYVLNREQASQLSTPMSPIEALSRSQRSARLARHLGNGDVIEPFLLNSPTTLNMAACMWISEDDLNPFINWSRNWSGAISLVVTTKCEPESEHHRRLLARLNSLRQVDQLSLHLIHTTTGQHSPALYLNLARFFATPKLVALFPGHPSQHSLPADSFNSLYSLVPQSIKKPLLVSANPVSPLAPHLAPIVLPQTSKTWCTERLSFMSSREADWSECSWQMWLEENELEHIKLNMSSSGDEQPSSAIRRIRDRMSSRFRAEMCEGAVRRLSPGEVQTSKTARRQLRWVKNFCKQTENSVKQHRGA
ncbi:hypothetical protein MIND_00072800 [Mycena indigotica]|uniref:Uncharacterized protein n=1 Tax=Mycena indigotica TaxID=2126181 RepID=A0A8H6TB78_9AGAR|nr:uncharacterized protein MIND_00072800 [Mycena indigotica]KAF7315575.1 hypothetical protein MIND_00072800 [Mycena indigotica]